MKTPAHRRAPSKRRRKQMASALAAASRGAAPARTASPPSLKAGRRLSHAALAEALRLTPACRGAAPERLRALVDELVPEPGGATLVTLTARLLRRHGYGEEGKP